MCCSLTLTRPVQTSSLLLQDLFASLSNWLVQFSNWGKNDWIKYRNCRVNSSVPLCQRLHTQKTGSTSFNLAQLLCFSVSLSPVTAIHASKSRWVRHCFSSSRKQHIIQKQSLSHDLDYTGRVPVTRCLLLYCMILDSPFLSMF